MSTTQKFQATNQAITIKRPSYKTFRDIAQKVSALLDVEPEVALTAPEFEQVLHACTEEDLTTWLEDAPYDEVIGLWDATIEHCEFQSFFAERQARHSEQSKAKTLWEVDLMAAQVKRMQKSGLLPANYSLEHALNETMTQGMNPTSLPSWLTGTPAGTDGPESKSSEKTSGSSSATSQKPPADAKPSRG